MAACAVAQLETVQVWQVHSVKTDNCFSAEARYSAVSLHTHQRKQDGQASSTFTSG